MKTVPEAVNQSENPAEKNTYWKMDVLLRPLFLLIRQTPWFFRAIVCSFPEWLRRKSVFGVRRPYFILAHDVVMAIMAIYLAGSLVSGVAGPIRFELAWSNELLLAGVVSLTVFSLIKLYRPLWRYTSLSDVFVIVKGVTFETMLLAVAFLVFMPGAFISLPVLVLNWLLLGALLSGPRFLARIATSPDKFRHRTNDAYGRIPILLVGAGDNTELFLRALAKDRRASYEAVGIVDEMGAYLRGSVHGVDILGRVDEISKVVTTLDEAGQMPRKLVVTDDRISPAAMRSLLDEAAANGMVLSRMPRVLELTNGMNERIELTPVAINDLMGRPQTVLDQTAMASLIKDARVLVTGAGGTIGSELTRQICGFDPAHITLVDNSELNLYEINLELRQKYPGIKKSMEMGDVRDLARVRDLMMRHRPTLVFHAAAMKHVSLVEENPAEGVLTNVLGTRNVADSCNEFGVEVMVLVSTDKAVNPTSVMGVTKRIAESYCQSLEIRGKDLTPSTRFVTVRFGNVLGSTGSVVPLFQRQLAMGGPITVTHPDVTRYFMTASEAVGLVLQGFALGARSRTRNGGIFVLEMGEPVRIRDLAHQMIRLAGFVPEKDIKTTYTGLRPGEKLFEEPLRLSEEMVPTEVSGILLATPSVLDHVVLTGKLSDLISAAQARARERMMTVFKELVPEYRSTAALAPFPTMPMAESTFEDSEQTDQRDGLATL